MEQPLRHPRLFAFYNSTVLNVLEIAICICLMSAGFVHDLMIPTILACAAFAVFILYTMWIWLKKPAQIHINPWLSQLASSFVFYFLIIAAIMPEARWWYIAPILPAAIIIIMAFTAKKGSMYNITTAMQA